MFFLKSVDLKRFKKGIHLGITVAQNETFVPFYSYFSYFIRNGNESWFSDIIFEKKIV